MEVVVEVKGRYQGRKDVESLFEKYATRLKAQMKRLSTQFKFKMPDQIILRPLYVKGGYYPYHGKAKWNFFTGFSILMNVETCLQSRDKGYSTLDEECAHVACLICHDDFGQDHGEQFREIYAACRAKKK